MKWTQLTPDDEFLDALNHDGALSDVILRMLKTGGTVADARCIDRGSLRLKFQ